MQSSRELGGIFDFSLPAIEAHIKAGLAAGRRALERLEKARPESTPAQALLSPAPASQRA
jgi:hypothetical protein